MSNEPIQSEFDLLKDRYNKELKTLKLYSIYIILYCISTILTFFNYIFINLSAENSIAYLLEKLNLHYYLSIFIIIIIIIIIICLLVAFYFTIIKPYIYFYRQKEISFDILQNNDRKNLNNINKCQKYLIIYLILSIFTGLIILLISISPIFKYTIISYICLFFTYLSSFMYIIPFFDLYSILFYLQCFKVWKLKKIILQNTLE